MKPKHLIPLLACLCTWMGVAAPFAYQGRLQQSGKSANGIYEFQVGLFSAATGGNQLGPWLTLAGIDVRDGMFSMELDFGEGVFNGQDRWLEIAVRSAGTDPFASLSPRQSLTAVPYAQFALTPAGPQGPQGMPGPQGPPGAQGVAGLTWRGTMDSFTEYEVNDVIEYDGESWVAVQRTSMGEAPHPRSQRWKLLAAKGQVGPKGDRGETGPQGPKGDQGEFPKIGPLGINVPAPLGSVGLHVAAPAGGSDALLLGGNLQGTLMVFGQTADNQGANYIGSIKTSGSWGELQLNPSGGTVSVGRNSGANFDVNGTVRATRFVGDGAGLANVPGTLGESITMVAWGQNGSGQTNVPSTLAQPIALSGGFNHSLGLTKDRRLIAWGGNGSGQSVVPESLTEVRAIAAGYNFTVVARMDGTIGAWGARNSGQIAFPGGLTGIIAVTAGYEHAAALKVDGTVVAWGSSEFRQTSVPADLRDARKIAAGLYHTLALREDGSVVGWGDNDFGQISVPSGIGPVVEIAAGGNNSMALLQNGTVVVWGADDNGQSLPPPGLTGIIAIAAGLDHFHALKGDGTLVSWGSNLFVRNTTPTGLKGVVAVAAGDSHVIVAKRTPTISSDLLVVGQVSAISVNTTSDRNAKERFSPIDAEAVLERVVSLPITQWNFKNTPGERHLGPMAQDFRAAFGLGTDERHIATVDADGVALAAIQGLNRKLEEQRQENGALRRELEALKQMIQHLNSKSPSSAKP